MKIFLGLFKKILLILLAKDSLSLWPIDRTGLVSQSKFTAIVITVVLTLVITRAFIVDAQAPSAGTSIGNQSTATFRDGAGTDRNVTSNLVETIVQQVASLTLTINGAKTATAGNEVIYPHILTNTGNGSDDFTLTLANAGRDDFDMNSIAIYADANQDGLPDNATDLNGTTVTLGAGEAFYFVVAGTTPGTTLDRQISDLMMTVTSMFDGSQTATNTDTTTITVQAVINTTKAVDINRGPAGSGSYTYTLTYTNTGDVTANLVTLTDTIPAGMMYVANSGRWSVTGVITLTDADSNDAQGTAPDTVIYDFGVTTAGTVTAVINQVESGVSGTLTFQVNVGVGATPGIINNTSILEYEDGSRTLIGPEPTNTVPFTVDPTHAVSISDNGSTTDDDGSVNDIVTETSAPQGGAANFDNVVENNGNATDTYNIILSGSTFPAGTTFQLYQSDEANPLIDTNGDSIPDTGSIAASSSAQVVVRAIVPPNAVGGGPYDVIVTAASTQDASVTDTVTDRLGTIAANAVDITNDVSIMAGATPGDGSGAGPEGSAVRDNNTDLGTTTTFSLFINNTGAAADSYDLAASTDNTFATLILPTGWMVQFYLDDGNLTRSENDTLVTNTGTLVAGGAALVFADISVPAGFAAGPQSLFFRALSPSTNVSDIIHDAVTVATDREVVLTPNHNGQAYPSGIVVYPHTLNNPGNVDENNGSSTVTISVSNSVIGFTTVVYYDINGNGIVDVGTDPVVADNNTSLSLPVALTAGGSLPLLARVSAPANAAIGTVDTTTITATTAGDINAVGPPPAAVATDTTIIISGDVSLQKTQALDADCDDTADTAFDTVNITAPPGHCICYEVTGTNTGSSNVNNIVINDTTPAYTTLSAVPTVTVGMIDTTPLLGGTGAISASVATLPPLETVVMSFCIQIDQ